MSIYLNKDSKIIVQGMTGGMGSKHTTLMVDAGSNIVGALNILGDEASKPLVVRLDGNNVEEGRRILAEAGHPLVTVEETMDGAARKAAELASAANKN